VKFSYPYIFLFFLIQACQKKPKVACAPVSPFGLEITIKKVKLVHLNDPTLTETEKQIQEKIRKTPMFHCGIDCEIHRGIYYTLFVKNHGFQTEKLLNWNFEVSNEYLPNQFRVRGFNQKGVFVNLLGEVEFPPKSETIIEAQIFAVFGEDVGIEVDSAELEAFYFAAMLEKSKNKTRLCYDADKHLPINQKKSTYRTIFIPDNTPIEIWYSRDFRTYEEARAYGQPYLAADGDTTRDFYAFQFR
jgi:hypothetical protein